MTGPVNLFRTREFSNLKWSCCGKEVGWDSNPPTGCPYAVEQVFVTEGIWYRVKTSVRLWYYGFILRNGQDWQNSTPVAIMFYIFVLFLLVTQVVGIKVVVSWLFNRW
jgi:hypothetical protein